MLLATLLHLLLVLLLGTAPGGNDRGDGAWGRLSVTLGGTRAGSDASASIRADRPGELPALTPRKSAGAAPRDARPAEPDVRQPAASTPDPLTALPTERLESTAPASSSDIVPATPAAAEAPEAVAIPAPPAAPAALPPQAEVAVLPMPAPAAIASERPLEPLPASPPRAPIWVAPQGAVPVPAAAPVALPAAPRNEPVDTALRRANAVPASIALDGSATPAAPPRATAAGEPGSTPGGSPDVAGARGGPAPATPVPQVPTAPRLNLDLPRPRGGEMSRQAPSGLLQLLPPPPARKSKLAEDIENAAKPDCRKAHSGLGLLAVVPLAIEAVKDGGCRW